MQRNDSWVRAWSFPALPPVAAFGPHGLHRHAADTTLRQIIRISGRGDRLRVRLSNEYGTAPLTIGAAHLGLAADGGTVRPGSTRALTFAGAPSVVVPAGAPFLSDSVDLPMELLSTLCISIYLPLSVETAACPSMLVEAGWAIPGNAVANPDLPADATPLPVRALVSAVEVLAGGPAKTIVTIGDSLTDGSGSTPNAYRRWPDVLAERLARHGGGATHVCNQGIGGNRMLNDGFGASALARFDRDVLSTPGLGYVIIAEGGNDILVSFAPRDAEGPHAEFINAFPGVPVTVDDIIAGYRQLIARARGRGIKIYAATITPGEGSEIFTPEVEPARQALNAWLRTSNAFDAVLDFDAVWRDPAHPSRIKDGFCAHDQLHGSDAGYRALAESIDLSLFS